MSVVLLLLLFYLGGLSSGFLLLLWTIITMTVAITSLLSVRRTLGFLTLFALHQRLTLHTVFGVGIKSAYQTETSGIDKDVLDESRTARSDHNIDISGVAAAFSSCASVESDSNFAGAPGPPDPVPAIDNEPESARRKTSVDSATYYDCIDPEDVDAALHEVANSAAVPNTCTHATAAEAHVFDAQADFDSDEADSSAGRSQETSSKDVKRITSSRWSRILVPFLLMTGPDAVGAGRPDDTLCGTVEGLYLDYLGNLHAKLAEACYDRVYDSYLAGSTKENENLVALRLHDCMRDVVDDMREKLPWHSAEGIAGKLSRLASLLIEA